MAAELLPGAVSRPPTPLLTRRTSPWPMRRVLSSRPAPSLLSISLKLAVATGPLDSTSPASSSPVQVGHRRLASAHS
jgi:hypothetical protein